MEDGEKKRGRLRHGCRNQNCASAPVVRGLTHPEITKLYAFSFFPSEVFRRFDEVRVHIGGT